MSAADLVAEDPRLTADQAAHIAEQLAVPPYRRRGDRPAAAPAAGPGEQAGGASSDVRAVIRSVLDQVLQAMPAAIGARLLVAGADGEVTEAVGSADGSPAIEVPFRMDSHLEGLVALHVPDGGSRELSEGDRRLLEAVGCFTGVAIAATRVLRETTADAMTARVAAAPFASLLSTIVGSSLGEQRRRAELAHAVRRVIALDQLATVFQPVVELADGRVVGYEALTRFPPEPPLSVQEWFSVAADLGHGPALEVAAARRAVAKLPEVPDGAFLAINVSPRTAVRDELADIVDGADPARIVLEVTEHAPVDDYGALSDALAGLRSQGMRLAIDDAGAGFASLRHVLRLAPDVIKLDISLVRRIDADPLRRALATSLITFATEAGATIVAEGIETRFERDTLVDLGVRYGQGNHLGHPGDLDRSRE